MSIVWTDLDAEQQLYVLDHVHDPLAVYLGVPGARDVAIRLLGDPETWQRDRRGEGSGHKFHGNQWGHGGKVEWKPMMSAADAAVYTKDSVLKGSFFHGTVYKGDDIIKNGFDLEKVGTATGNTGMLGRGVYLTSYDSYAAQYAGSGKVYETRVLVKNPMNHPEFMQMVRENDLQPFGPDGAKIADMVQARGFDAVHWVSNPRVDQETLDELVVFKKEQIVITAVESNA